MESIIAYPRNEKQISLLKSLFNEMKVRFEVANFSDETLLSEKDFFSKIDKSVSQLKLKKTKILSKSDQKEFLGL
jgi:hypothetical protein